jgi:phosphatidylglycerophosphatase A
MGSLKRAALSLLPATATLVTLLGLVATAGMELNYMNIIVLPVLLGIGVDGAVHLVLRGMEPTVHSGGALGETGRAIAGANLTTALGFGALMIADHPGLDSLGSLAVVGLSVNLLVTLVALPALLSMAGSRRPSHLGSVSTRWLRWRRRLFEQVATVGRAGYSPIAPGTVGALLALPLAYVLSDAGWEVKIGATILIIAGGWWASQRYSAESPENDPQEVVVDELAGTTIALLFVPFQPLWAIVTFGLFRLFDIWKPGPVGWADRRLHGGLGIMADDVLAGLMAGVTAYGLHRLSVLTELFPGG